MIDYGLLLKDVRRDVLAWPGGRSVQADYEPDAFAPSTLAVVAEWLAAVPRAQELIALAETAQWSRAAADELIDLIDDWRATNSAAIQDNERPEYDAAMAALEHARRAKAGRAKGAPKATAARVAAAADGIRDLLARYDRELAKGTPKRDIVGKITENKAEGDKLRRALRSRAVGG